MTRPGPAVRLPWPEIDWAREEQPAPPRAAHYLTTVRRLTDGDSLLVFDTRGREALARLVRKETGWHLALLSAPAPGRTAAPARLAYALPRGEKLDDVLRQVTELGISAVLLFQAERSVSRLDGADGAARAEKKRVRWERVVAEAARQCGRADVPEVAGPVTLAEALEATTGDASRAVLHPEGGAPWGETIVAAPASVFVGPEGGFSPAELARFDGAGVERLRLACPVLRTETAAVVATSLLLHRLGAL